MAFFGSSKTHLPTPPSNVQTCMLVGLNQVQPVEIKLFPQPVHIVDDVAEFLRPVKMTDEIQEPYGVCRPVLL